MKARNPSTYYMLIPLAGLLMTIMSSINIIISRFKFFEEKLKPRNHLSDKIYLKSLFIFTLCGFMVFHTYNYSAFFNDSKYTRLSQHSNNMSQTFRTIADELELSKDKTYHFAFPPNEHHFYLLRGGTEGIDNTLINFIYQVDGDYLVDYIEYNDMKEISQLVKEKNAYYIILDSQYNLLNLKF